MSERATKRVIRTSIAKLDAARLEAALRTLEQVAAANERCPANDEIGHGVVSALAAAGKIEVEIYGRNFRRVTLLTGAHAGAMTKGPPNARSRPYAITGPQRHAPHRLRSTERPTRAALRTAVAHNARAAGAMMPDRSAAPSLGILPMAIRRASHAPAKEPLM